SRRAGPGDLLEHLALVGRVALDRLDQVRDEVVPPPELGVDVRPRVVDELAARDEAVVGHHGHQGDDHHDAEDDPERDHDWSFPAGRISLPAAGPARTARTRPAGPGPGTVSASRARG